MKKKITYISFVLLAFFSIAATQTPEECDSRALKSELKPKLKPEFKYDSSKTSRFNYKNKKQVKEIEIPLFMGEKYRFLFNTAGLPKDIEIGIYNKPTGHKKRKLLYELKEKEGEHIYVFEPSKSKKMYLTYTIPAVELTNNEELRGCMVLLIGFKTKL